MKNVSNYYGKNHIKELKIKKLTEDKNFFSEEKSEKIFNYFLIIVFI